MIDYWFSTPCKQCGSYKGKTERQSLQEKFIQISKLLFSHKPNKFSTRVLQIIIFPECFVTQLCDYVKQGAMVYSDSLEYYLSGRESQMHKLSQVNECMQEPHQVWTLLSDQYLTKKNATFILIFQTVLPLRSNLPVKVNKTVSERVALEGCCRLSWKFWKMLL